MTAWSGRVGAGVAVGAGLFVAVAAVEVAATGAVGDAATPGWLSVGRVSHEPIASESTIAAAAVAICQRPKIDRRAGAVAIRERSYGVWFRSIVSIARDSARPRISSSRRSSVIAWLLARAARRAGSGEGGRSPDAASRRR